MMKHFIDPNAKLTNKKMEDYCNDKCLQNLKDTTYKTFDFNSEERMTVCQITMLESEPAVYIESFINDNFSKKWVSVKDGLVLKELIYDSEGFIINS